MVGEVVSLPALGWVKYIGATVTSEVIYGTSVLPVLSQVVSPGIKELCAGEGSPENAPLLCAKGATDWCSYLAGGDIVRENEGTETIPNVRLQMV